MIKTLEWTDAGVRFIDQTKLPTEETYVTCKNYEEVADAIRTMIVRGAPAIGVAAAMGVALGTLQSKAQTLPELEREFDTICNVLAGTRPTAVNLFWAIQRMRDRFLQLRAQPLPTIRRELVEEAQRVLVEDIAANEAMGKHGAVLLPSSGGVLTHCNAGALATAGYGTALGVIRAAVESGKQIQVFADETRPFLQGSRLTAWELMKDGIPTTLIADNMAGAMMRLGKIDAVIVGADRIAANGDVANKIGTYTVAVLAKRARHSVLRGGAYFDRRLEYRRWQPDSHRAARVIGGDASCRQADCARRSTGGEPRVRRHSEQIRDGHHHRTGHCQVSVSGIPGRVGGAENHSVIPRRMTDEKSVLDRTPFQNWPKTADYCGWGGGPG